MCQHKEAAAHDHGLMEIYQQMMTIDLFQTQYGGWFSNLPWEIKSLIAMLLLINLLDAIPWETERLKDLALRLCKLGSIAYAVWRIYCVYQNYGLPAQRQKLEDILKTLAQIRESEPNKFNLDEVEKKAHDKLEKVWMKIVETI